jgi:integrase
VGLELKLTDWQCRIAKPRERAFNLTDGGGFFLQVKPNGSKLWRCDYAFGGKRATANFGPYPITSLVQARHRRNEFKDKIRAGIDPRAKLDDDRPKFDAVAREWFMVNKSKWEPSYSTRVWSRIEDDILPVLGPKAIADIKPPEVLAVLRKVESRDGQSIYTARRLHQFVSTVFKFAIAGGLVEINPAANLHPALKPVPRGKHRAALKEAELPEFFRRLHGTPMDESTRLGLKAVAHVFVRTDEIRFAKWSEFDWGKDVWTIPAERMKMRRELRVPLSRQSRAIFQRLRELADGSELVLPGPYRHKPVSANCLLFALYRAGFHGRATVHGFRSTASTILNESEDPAWDRDAIEHQLAHAPDDAIRAAYDRGERWQTRVRMMQFYSDLLDGHEKRGLATRNLADLLD